jgi:hemoglobin-like flavoprotein
MPTPIESYRRLRRTARFAPRFYENLLGADPRIRRMFARTNFEKQHALFEHGVHILLEYAAGSAIGEMAVKRLGKRHSPSDLDVDPALYEIWIDCLVATARELDPKWSPALEKRFRGDLRKGIDEMTRAYNEAS